jgi:hypothetical protein
MKEFFIAGLLWALSVHLFRYAYKSGKQRVELDQAIQQILNEGKK